MPAFQVAMLVSAARLVAPAAPSGHLPAPAPALLHVPVPLAPQLPLLLPELAVRVAGSRSPLLRPRRWRKSQSPPDTEDMFADAATMCEDKANEKHVHISTFYLPPFLLDR